MNTDFYTERNRAIDLFRALTMTVMIFVNDMWRVSGIPHWLEHGDWGEDFMGLADFVFPCFLVAVGMSIPYAIENRFCKGKSAESTLLHILLRTLALIVMGVFLVNSEGGVGDGAPYTKLAYRPLAILGFFLVWNVYPKSWSRWLSCALQCAGVGLLCWLAFTFVDCNGGALAARWWGILGLIGWSYVFCAIAYMLCRNSRYAVYWVWAGLCVIAVFTSPVKDSLGGESIIMFKDNFLYSLLHDSLHIDNGVHHLLVLSGVCIITIAARLNSKPLNIQIKAEVSIVVVAIVLSLACNLVWIFNKLTPTLPWALMAVAASAAIYFTFYHYSERSFTKVTYKILRPAGTATLTVYMVPSLLYSVYSATEFELPELISGTPWGLIYCIIFSLACIAIGGLMERCHIKLKV